MLCDKALCRLVGIAKDKSQSLKSETVSSRLPFSFADILCTPYICSLQLAELDDSVAVGVRTTEDG